MQVVILAAGFGTRMRPLTYHVPKPMIKIAGKNLIEHNIDNLPLEKISEIIIVVGYLKEQVINHFGKQYKGIPVSYVEQKKPLGTGHAIKTASPKIKTEKFIVFMGDDLYSKEDLKIFVESEELLLGVKEVKSKFKGGKIIFDKSNNLMQIKEGLHTKGGLVNAALYKLDKDFLNMEPVKIDGRNEFGLPQTLVEYANKKDIKLKKLNGWRQHSDIEDLIKSEKKLFKVYGRDNQSALKYFLGEK